MLEKTVLVWGNLAVVLFWGVLVGVGEIERGFCHLSVCGVAVAGAGETKGCARGHQRGVAQQPCGYTRSVCQAQRPNAHHLPSLRRFVGQGFSLPQPLFHNATQYDTQYRHLCLLLSPRALRHGHRDIPRQEVFVSPRHSTGIYGCSYLAWRCLARVPTYSVNIFCQHGFLGASS